MSRLATSFVLGYHGCDQQVADSLLAGKTSVKQSRQPYDWLGPGSYFWEADPQRAEEWAKQKVERVGTGSPAVVGAVIDLGHCLDLTNRANLTIIKGAYDAFLKQQAASELPLPKNKSIPNQPDLDRTLRFLDCAVIQHLHDTVDEAISAGANLQSFDTVRGVFTEGGELFDGSGFYERTHTQIAVLNDKQIIGLFKPLRL